MKKLLIFPLFLFAFALFSAGDYEACVGLEGRKSLACSACHANSISGDVFIVDGKDEEEEDVEPDTDENTYNYTFVIPVRSSSYLQVSASNEGSSRIRKVEMPLTNVFAQNDREFSFNRLSIGQLKSIDKDIFQFEMSYTFEEAITEPTIVMVQGVLSNNDGTSAGDYSFSKEILVQPKAKLLAASLEFNSYFNKGVLYVQQEAADQVRVLNLQGQVVYNSVVPAIEAIDLSGLENGVYFAIVGSKAANLQNIKFVK